MSQIRIKTLCIEGFRGAKNKVSVDLGSSGQSLLVYGDNGTGKSTISDSVQWFFFDKISHLKGEEIGKHEGIRHKEISDSDSCYAEVQFSNNTINSVKSLESKAGKLKATHSNSSNEFKSYLESSQKENIVIRNEDLVNFIISTKSERLAEISDLIGYSDVIKLKKVLKKAVGDLASLIKAKAFESSKTAKQAQLLKIISSNVYTREQLFASIDSLVSKINIGYKIDSEESFKKLKDELAKVKLSDDAKNKIALTKAISNVESSLIVFNQLHETYRQYRLKYNELMDDQEKLKGVKLKSLLESASRVITSKVHDSDSCPVCLREMPKNDLLSSIRERLESYKKLEESVSDLNRSKGQIVQGARDIWPVLNEISKLEILKQENLKDMRDKVSEALSQVTVLGKSFAGEAKFEKKDQYDCEFKDLSKDFLSSLKSSLEEVNNSIKETDDPRIELAQKVVLAESLFNDIKTLVKEEQVIQSQKDTMAEVYSRYSKLQEKEMESFLSAISVDMNEFFKFMNPLDSIDEISLQTVNDKDGDFVGISYSLSFRGTAINAPKMYLSESYLNCLGLCLFLASVKIFNKKNAFFVLDDVISSFDKNHRVMFARLLVEKFNDWQMIALTHEDEWFAYFASQVKNKNWAIKRTIWSSANGTAIEAKAAGLKEEIDNKISRSDESGLGNLLGRYTESLLKELCVNLEARIAFKKNDRNEERSFDELFGALRSRLKEKKTGLDANSVIQNLDTTQFFRNKTSHGNGFGENLADMKVCYLDLQKFEALFTCSKTGGRVSTKYFNPANNTIQTKSQELSFNWK